MKEPGDFSHEILHMKHRKVRGCNISRLALLVIFILGIMTSISAEGRAFARALLLLPALVEATEPAPLLLVGEPIQHTKMTIQTLSGPAYLDIYAPSTPDPLFVYARSGILIVPGVGDNRNVPQLMNLVESFARTGIVVMTMTTPTLINYDISVQDTDATIKAFQILTRLLHEKRHVGMIAFSGGVPIACFAAADPRIRDDVAFVATFGGYFNAKSVLSSFGRRAIDVDGKTETWKPIDVPLVVLANMTTNGLSLAEMKRIRNAITKAIPLSDDELAELSPGAQADYHLLVGDEPGRVDANMEVLPASVKAQLEVLSPSRVVSNIHAPLFLLHDRNDHSLPVTESRAFDQALTKLHYPHQYVEFRIFDHVEMRSGLGIWQMSGDGARLFYILYSLLYVEE